MADLRKGKLDNLQSGQTKKKQQQWNGNKSVKDLPKKEEEKESAADVFNYYL